MSRKRIGLRIKDKTRDQLERVRGGLSRTDYVEGAVWAQIARDLKKTETPHEYSLDDGKPVQKIDMVEDGPAGPMFVWLCDLCGQPLNQWEKCNSGIHVGPKGTGSTGTPVKSTILAALLRQSKDHPVSIIEDNRMPPNMAVNVPSGGVFVDGRKIEKPFFGGGIVGARISPQANVERERRMDDLKRTSSNSFTICSSAKSRAGVVPVPKKAQKGRK